VVNVQATLDCSTIGKLLMMLEAALKSEALQQSWTVARDGWRTRLVSGCTAAVLQQAVEELEGAIQWDRIMLHPDAQIARGRALPTLPSLPSPDEMDTATDGESAAAEPPVPPEGVPRVALRMLLLLRAMGVRAHSPNVVLQLLEVMHTYTSDILGDAMSYARMRQLATAQGEGGAPPPMGAAQRPTQRQRAAGPGASADAGIERADVALAVRGRCRKSFLPPPKREELAQHAALMNVQPMPPVTRKRGLQLPPVGERGIGVGVLQEEEEEEGDETVDWDS
jgi:transcription initiation factor TFIID subunit 9B